MRKMQSAIRSAAGIAVLSLAWVNAAPAATLVTFKPYPISPTTPEFSFDGSLLNEAAGTSSSGDGATAPPSQAAPGLQIDTPFNIPAIAGGVVNVGGSTTFYDASLELNGFSAIAPAAIVFGTLIQPLILGDFSIKATDGTVLLHGVVQSSAITGANGGTAGAAFSSANVTYDGGLIFQKLSQAGGTLNGNDFSFSFVDATPSFSINGQTGRLSAFTANATGLFNATVLPEPTTAALLALSAAGLMGRRRRA
jgi:hypothetical protein